MRNFLFRSGLALSLMLTGQTILAQSSFSPTVNQLRSSYQTRRAASADADKERGAFIVTCSENASTAAIANEMKTLGAEIRVLMGDQLLIDLPVSQLEAAAAIEGVLLVDTPPEATDKTDQTRKASHVDEAHQGKAEGLTNLPHAYTGKGIIIGLIDSGYDFTHPMFKDKDGKLRIKGVYQAGSEALRSEGEPLDDIEIIDDKGISTTLKMTGQFITNPDVILDTLKMKDTQGSHGSHCAAIAAGSIMDGADGVTGLSGTGYLGGMAPEAELLLSSSTVTKEQREKYPERNINTDYNAMQAMFAMKHYAQQQKKPLVISWSQNGHDGFHDGTSSKARYIANYCKQGNVIALCASNEGNVAQYVGRAITKGKTLKIKAADMIKYCDVYAFIKTSKEVKADLAVVDDENNILYTCNLPLTSAGTQSYEQEFMTGVRLDSDGSKIWTYYDQYYKDNGPRGNLREYIQQGSLWLEIGKGQGRDKDNQVFDYVRVRLTGRNFATEEYRRREWYSFVICITPVEEDANVQAWTDGFSLAANTMEDEATFINGLGEYSIGDWNTSGEPVSIGAYAANIKQKNSRGEIIESTKEQLGRYASFSSYGYDFSEAKRKYPDVSTPGVSVVAADNSFSPAAVSWAAKDYSGQFKGQSEPRTYQYIFKSGTSMATPVAAGIIALWMEAAKDKNKTVTNAYIKEVIANSSDTDEFTQETPIRYGAGKMNAYKGLLYILDLTTSVPELPTEHISAMLNGRTLHISGNPDVQVTIYNLSGVKVLDTQAQGGIVDLPNLPAGVYAVKIGNQGSTLIRL